MAGSCAYLGILKSFSELLFYMWPLGNCLFHVQVAAQQTFVLMKTSWSSRRLDQEEYVRLSLTSSEDFFKTSWSRPIYSFWPYVFKTSSRRLQDVFKTSSRRLQDVFKTSSRCLQDLFKTSCKNVFKTFSRRTMRLNCLPRSHLWICVC